ncbi:MAG: hypothetical protein HZA46_12590 [Planctomycetales bacterium]|nr:hypothetical protein [Planctomycetales bacterium]
MIGLAFHGRRGEPNNTLPLPFEERAGVRGGAILEGAHNQCSGTLAPHHRPLSPEGGEGSTRTRRTLSVIIGVLLLAVTSNSTPLRADEPASKPAKFDPTSRYESQVIQGWTVLVHRTLSGDHPDLCDETLALLRVQLYQITRVVPQPAVEQMRKIKIWVEHVEPHHPCMCYHPDPRWLREHDMNPEKAGAVEIANAKNFLKWTIAQPWMVLHELAHGYHHQFLDKGYDNADVLETFRAAKEAKTYESVLRIQGRRERHYALTNQMEYFAEASEAYFGTNDFFPYVRSELREHDPAFEKLLGTLWSGEDRQPAK